MKIRTGSRLCSCSEDIVELACLSSPTFSIHCRSNPSRCNASSPPVQSQSSQGQRGRREAMTEEKNISKVNVNEEKNGSDPKVDVNEEYVGIVVLLSAAGVNEESLRISVLPARSHGHYLTI